MNDDSNPSGRVISGPPPPLERAETACWDQPVGWDRMSEAKPYEVRCEQSTTKWPVAMRGRGTFFGKIVFYKSARDLDVEMVRRLYQESLLTLFAPA